MHNVSYKNLLINRLINILISLIKQSHTNTSECTIREYFVYTEPALILNAKFSASLMLRNLYIGRYAVRYLCFNVTALLEY